MKEFTDNGSDEASPSSSARMKRSFEDRTEPESGLSDPSDSPMKKAKSKRKLHLAVTGCSHGEMDKIYASAAEIEKREGWKFDLLICTGDYQAVRNYGDLEHMNVPPKYRSLQTFHRYYSGEAVAPILTLVIGGNHEASGYMQELPYGGWIAPRIYYLGYSSVVSFAGLRIAGLSGIYNSSHYDMGHFERPPFAQHGSIISVYHVRSVDVFRLKQLEPRKDAKDGQPIDIMISHDWPSGITDYGDVEELLRVKSYFADDIKKSALGNPATMALLHQLRPRYWFSSHLHCAFAALVSHENPTADNQPAEFTHFLALDKPIPGRQFLQSLEIEIESDAEMTLRYDPTWLAVLKLTDHLTSASNRKAYMPAQYPPSNERWDFRPSVEEIETITGLFENDFVIPENFMKTAPPHEVFQTTSCDSESYYRNPQTTLFCKKLGIQDLNGLLCELSPEEVGMPFFVSETKTEPCKDEVPLCDAKHDTEDLFFIDKSGLRDTGPNIQEEVLEAKSGCTEEQCSSETTNKQTATAAGESRRVGSGIFKRRQVDIPEEE